MEITYRKSAIKVLRGMQPAKRDDIREGIKRVAAEPLAPNNNLKPLVGVKDGFRLRVGDWRVSFTIDREAKVMDIFEIAPRGGAYR